MLASFLTKVSLGWLARRIPDIGGWVGTVVLAILGFWNSMSPEMQETVMRVLQGNWKEITLGALPGIFVYIAGQVASWRATTTPQVVTPAGNKIVTPEPPNPKPAINIPILGGKKGGKSLLDRLLGRE